MSSEVRSKFVKQYEGLVSSIVKKARDTYKNQEEYDSHLCNLKMRFSKLIPSVRRLDAADDVKALIHLLEKRLLVGWFDVEKLQDIIVEFELDDLVFADYEDYLVKLCQCKLKHKNAFLPPPYDPEIFGDVVTTKDVIPPRVTDCISSKMGSDWRFFAREMISLELAVEKDFDVLDKSSHLSSQEKTERLLEQFVRGDKRCKRSQLLKILRTIRRNDLDEEVSRLFLENDDEE